MKKKFGIYFLILSVVLIGLLWIQYFWIEYSIRLKSDEYKKQVNKAMINVADKIEDQYFCFRLYADISLDKDDNFYLIKHHNPQKGITETRNEALLTNDTILPYYYKTKDDPISLDNLRLSAPANAKVVLDFEFDYYRTLSIQDTVGGFKEWIINSYRNTLMDDSTSFRIVDTVSLKRTMHEQLSRIGIDSSTYQYGISKLNGKELIYANTVNPDTALIQSEFNITVYDNDNFYNPYVLHLYIPNWNVLLLKNLWVIIISSVGILAVLIWMIVFFMRVIINQRKLNEMKSDFINNMTHEFNTPVSNINLALDTIERQYNGSTDRLWKIIREENKRIQENIALILQTSVMEKKKLAMNKELTDLKEVILRVVGSFELKIAERKGSMKTHFMEGVALASVDEGHLSNLLHNLLDNAMKYSKEKLDIEVILQKAGDNYTIVVKDKGIGILEHDLDKIFDRFYRVSTGKVHDVKGFGLGLHYVQQVINAHEGMIEVKSKPGRGSEFTVLLPE